MWRQPNEFWEDAECTDVLKCKVANYVLTNLFRTRQLKGLHLLNCPFIHEVTVKPTVDVSVKDLVFCQFDTKQTKRKDAPFYLYATHWEWLIDVNEYIRGCSLSFEDGDAMCFCSITGCWTLSQRDCLLNDLKVKLKTSLRMDECYDFWGNAKNNLIYGGVDAPERKWFSSRLFGDESWYLS